MTIKTLKYVPGITTASDVRLPLSKSIAVRALTLNAVSEALGNGKARIPQLPDSEDVAGMIRAMHVYDAQCAAEADARHIVNIGEGGAPFRFFTALAASTPGTDISVFTRKSLMRRPLSILIDALRYAGADIRCMRRDGFPPLRIIGQRLHPGAITLDPSVSSQFVSAFMMAAPLWDTDLDLRFPAPPVSAPYIRMTAEIMRRFGCDVTVSDNGTGVRHGECHAPETFEIESDWSAASYFYETALLAPGREIRVESLTPADSSLQGDSRCEEIFRSVGVSTTYHSDGSATLRCDPRITEEVRLGGIPMELDMNATPDLVPALTVAFGMARLPFRFTSVAHLRHKETDRMAALAAEMAKLGIPLTLGDDEMSWDGTLLPPTDGVPQIATYSDHRMAMAFAPAALATGEIRIESPGVTAKSFPGFWKEIAKIIG